MTNETRTVTRKQFALAAGVSLSTIDRLISAGQLNHLRVGRRVLFAMPRHLEDYQMRFERRVESRRMKIVR